MTVENISPTTALIILAINFIINLFLPLFVDDKEKRGRYLIIANVYFAAIILLLTLVNFK